MASEVGPIQITYVANLREALASFKEFGSALKEVGEKARESFSEISESIGLFENVGSVVGGAVALKGFSDFDHAIANIRATLRLSQADFEATRQKILDLSGAFFIDATQTANAYGKIARAGYEAAEAQEVLTAALEASKATSVDVAATAGVLTQVLKTYKIGAEGAADTTGKLVAASQLGTFSFSELSGAMGTLAPIAKQAGLGLDDLLASLTSLSREQGNVEQTVGGLRALLTQLINPAAAVEQKLVGILGTTAKSSIANRGFAETFKLINAAVEAGNIAIEEVFPNARELGAVLKLVGDGARSLDKDLSRIKDSGAASLKEAVKIQEESLTDLIEDLEKLPKLVATEVFDKNKVAITASVRAIKDFAEANRGMIVGLAGVAAALPLVSVGLLAVKFSASSVVALYDGLKSVFGLLRSGGSGIAGLASDAGGAVSAIRSQIAALNDLVPLRVRDASALAVWRDGQKAAAVAQNALDLATLRQAESLAALRLAEAEASSVAAASLAVKQKQVAAAEARVAALAEEAAAARIASTVSQEAAAASVAADAALLDAEVALAAARSRLAVASDAEIVAEQRLAAAKAASAAASEAVAVAEGAQAAVAASNAAASTAAAASAATFGGQIKALFPTFASFGSSLKDLPGLFSGISAGLRSFGSNLTSVAGVVGLLRGGLGGLLSVVTATGSMLYSIATGVLGVLLTKLALILGTAYAAYKLGSLIGNAIRDYRSADGSVEESERIFADIEAKTKDIRNARTAALNERAGENARAVQLLIDKYRELSQESAKASAGDVAAAENVKRLREEIGKLEDARAVQGLTADVQHYAQVIGDSIDAAKELGIAGADAVSVQRDKYGRVISITGDYAKVVADVGTRLEHSAGEAGRFGSNVVRSGAEARSAAEGYKKYGDLIAEVSKAEDEAGLSTRALESAQSQLNLAIGTARDIVGTYKDSLKKLSDAQFKSGLSEEQRAVFDLADEYRKLTDTISQLAAAKENLLAKQAAAGDDAKNDPAAKRAIEDINAQLKVAGNARRENERLTNDAIARERLAATKRVAEAEIAALAAKGKIEESERRKADLARAQSAAAAEAALAADLRGRDAIIAKAAEQLEAEKKRIDLSDEGGGAKARELADAQRAYEARIKLAKSLEAEALARYPREKQAVEDLYNAELEDIERNRRKRFEATDEGRRLVEDVDRARKQAESLEEAARLRALLVEAQKRSDIREEASLRDQLLQKLREAGDVAQANLERERQSRVAIRERLLLLRDELDTRFRIGGLKADFASAARGAQADLAGSSDAASFRGAVRGRFADDPTEAAVAERRLAILEALKREEQALNLSRQQLSRSDADYQQKAAEIAEKQREVLEKVRILNQEAERAKAEARNNRPVNDTAQRGAEADQKLSRVGPGPVRETFTQPGTQPAAPASSQPKTYSDAPNSITTPNVFVPGKKAEPGKGPAPNSPSGPASPSSPAGPASPAAPSPPPPAVPPSPAPAKVNKRKPYPGYVEYMRYKVKGFGGGPDRVIVVFVSMTTGAYQYIPEDELDDSDRKAPASPSAPPAPAPAPATVTPAGGPSAPSPSGTPSAPASVPDAIVENLKGIGDSASRVAGSSTAALAAIDKFSAVVRDGFAVTDKSLRSIAARLDETAAVARKSADAISATGRAQENARMGG